MSHTWKLLPLAAVFALGLVMLVPGSPISSRVAHAALDTSTCNTSDGHRLSVDIIDQDTGDRITIAGSQVTISPDPQDGVNTRSFTDNGANDDSSTIGRIQQNDACEVTGSAPSPTAYTITLDALPDALADCDIGDPVQTTLTTDKTVELSVQNCPGLTPTATATSVTPTTTVGPASAMTISASPATLGCNGTSIITVQVKDASGNAVAAGTAVTLTASQGSVSPTSGTTASDGSLFVFYSATGNANGAVTVGATSGSATGTTTVTVNCSTAATATTAPPPTVVATVSGGGVISPPNTGDAGLSNSDNGIGWQTYGGIALVIASALGALVLVRSRVRD